MGSLGVASVGSDALTLARASLHPPDSVLPINSAASRMTQASETLMHPATEDRLETVLGNVKFLILLPRFFY